MKWVVRVQKRASIAESNDDAITLRVAEIWRRGVAASMAPAASLLAVEDVVLPPSKTKMESMKYRLIT